MKWRGKKGTSTKSEINNDMHRSGHVPYFRGTKHEMPGEKGKNYQIPNTKF
jgi:hypothetical protein